MDKSQAQTSVKNINNQLLNLTPSALITLFEIDIEQILTDSLISTSLPTIYRFHNMNKLLATNIIWQGNTYYAAPVKAEGFELNSRGTLPTPKLSLTVSSDGIPVLAQLKELIFSINDLTGAKVTRIRTFARFLDAANFLHTFYPTPVGASGSSSSSYFLGFEPDTSAELPRDIYHIERKSNENKLTIEYELSSAWDVQGIKLPGRLVISDKCSWTYRGEGCLYDTRRNVDVHGANSTLPASAPPVATDNDELIYADGDNPGIVGGSHVDSGQWTTGTEYSVGNAVFIIKNKINYYFVCKTAHTSSSTNAPPNSTYWVLDMCGKRIKSCKLRWANIPPGTLPTAAFPSVSKLSA